MTANSKQTALVFLCWFFWRKIPGQFFILKFGRNIISVPDFRTWRTIIFHLLQEETCRRALLLLCFFTLMCQPGCSGRQSANSWLPSFLCSCIIMSELDRDSTAPSKYIQFFYLWRPFMMGKKPSFRHPLNLMKHHPCEDQQMWDWNLCAVQSSVHSALEECLLCFHDSCSLHAMWWWWASWKSEANRCPFSVEGRAFWSLYF